MEKDSFKEKLMKAKQEALQNAVSFLQGSLAECADTLMQIIKDNDTSPQTKVNACQVVMGQCKTWTDEIDVINRIAALERVMEKENGEQWKQRKFISGNTGARTVTGSMPNRGHGMPEIGIS